MAGPFDARTSGTPATSPRLGIPSLRTSDGPNGIRGQRFFNGDPSHCLPCGTGLAATWDAALLRRAGAVLLGRACAAQGAHIWLGPTVNMLRSPLGGRGFESYSEDPFLSGAMAAAVVAGVQSHAGVAACIKHFVCNDQEHERQAVDCVVSERALREIYLMPFMLAQRDAKPLCYMTSYSRLNGVHVSENSRLMEEVLRKEWGFDGLIMSDWYAYSGVVPLPTWC
ncbi:beta-glucosidase [Apiospora hydei]|uniref:beta-glucosidase n=1 Tax=Apiospora hydei TaxID=1337664 RepID=A0ABR1X9V0_9PEZI